MRSHVLPHQPGEEHRPGAAALREEPAGSVAREAEERGASANRVGAVGHDARSTNPKKMRLRTETMDAVPGSDRPRRRRSRIRRTASKESGFRFTNPPTICH